MKTTKLSVGKAYLLQAKEDLSATQAVGKNIKQSPSTLFMLLQMVFEKLMKADNHRGDYTINNFNHKGAGSYFRKYFDAYIRTHQNKGRYNRIVVLIQDLENAQPSIAKKISPNAPQLEYPWADKNGEICYPAKDLPLVQKLNNLNYAILVWETLKFAMEFANELEAKI